MKAKTVLLVIVVVSLCGCGSISGKGLADAIQACDPNGGVHSISAVTLLTSDSYIVKCNNGLTIESIKEG